MNDAGKSGEEQGSRSPETMHRRDFWILLRVTGLYAIFSSFWIFLSDHLVSLAVREPEALSQLQTLKGLFFVLASACVILLLLRQELRLRRRTEAAWRQSERRYALDLERQVQRLRQLADSMPQMVWIADARGQATYFNVKWSDFTGTRPTGEPLARAIGPAVLREDLPRLNARLERAFETGEGFEVECRLRSTEGQLRWHLARGLPVRSGGDTGEIESWFGTFTDIDEQKRTQQALLDEDRQKSEFIALLGHELRNPLAPITTAVHIMKQAPQRPPLFDRPLEIIERQARHMARLVNDLLTLSRIARGKVTLELVLLDLVQLVRTAVDDRRETIQARGLALAVDLPALDVPVQADPDRLTQALHNLLDNAEKFTAPGGRLTVSVRREGARAQIRVSDTGVGMNETTLGQLFTPFLRSPEASRGKQGAGGLGLGLALVHGLARLHRGSIRASSPGPGKGSEFLLELPVTERPESPKAAAQSTGNGAGPRHRIVVIDDNADLAETLRMSLELSGHRVAVALTGEEGVECVRRFRPNIVLSDIGLPGELDGYAVARKLRQDPLLRKTRLIAISGFGQEEDRQNALAAGFELHLTKPIDQQALERLLAGVPAPES